jgi:hypothetical protein
MWKLIFVFLIGSVVLYGKDCTQIELSSDEIVDIRELFGTDITKISENITPCGGLMVQRSQFYDYVVVVFKEINYKVAFGENSIIIHISPDPAISPNPFFTSEGIYLGMTFRELCEKLNNPNIQLRKYFGYGCVVELASGWKAGFTVGKSWNDFPGDNDIVTFIYYGIDP